MADVTVTLSREEARAMGALPFDTLDKDGIWACITASQKIRAALAAAEQEGGDDGE